MKFSQDWFTHNTPTFEHIRTSIGSCQRILEIGCFEGRATCWMLSNMLDEHGFITCIDTFKGSVEHENLRISNLMDVHRDNYQEVCKKTQTVEVLKGRSTPMLALLIHENKTYDFIYVDGSHSARDVLTDACMAWELLKPGGVMLFDDYLWMDMPNILDRPNMAIDQFVLMFGRELQLVALGYQLGVQKLPI